LIRSSLARIITKNNGKSRTTAALAVFLPNIGFAPVQQPDSSIIFRFGHIFRKAARTSFSGSIFSEFIIIQSDLGIFPLFSDIFPTRPK
jgi:hypothetical protein